VSAVAVSRGVEAGVEPSCVAVSKDELVKLWPDHRTRNGSAGRATTSATSWPMRDGWEPPSLHRKAVLHGHCRCGWGDERGHYDVSIACGERVLLPKVREAAPDTLVVADGFSCRSQIEQGGTARRALHAAQVLALARQYGPAGPPGLHPERAAPGRPAASRAPVTPRVAAAAALVATTALGFRSWRGSKTMR
jgi:hypothetical protein